MNLFYQTKKFQIFNGNSKIRSGCLVICSKIYFEQALAKLQNNPPWTTWTTRTSFMLQAPVQQLFAGDKFPFYILVEFDIR